MVYEPSSTVEWLHELPRKDLAFNDVSNVFPANDFDPASFGDDTTSGKYLQGAFFTTVILIIVGSLMFAFLGAGFIFSFCCSKRCCKKRREGGADGKVVVASKRYTILFLVLACASALCAFLTSVGVSGVLTAMDNGNSVGHDLVDIVDDISTETNNLDVSGQGISSESTALAAAIRDDSTIPNEIADTVEDMGTASGDMISATGSAADGLDFVSDNFNTFLRDEDSRSPSEDLINQGGYALGALTGVVMLVYIASALVSKRIAKPVFAIFAVIALILLLLVWIASGAILSFGVIMGDVCMDPSSNVLDLMGSQGGSGGDDGVDALRYYMTCTTDPDAVAGGFFRDLNQTANDAFTEVRSAFSEVQSDLSTFSNPTVDDHMENIQNYITDTENSFNNIIDPEDGILGCPRIGGLWQDSLTVLCGDFFSNGIMVFWTFLLLTGIFLTLTLIMGMRYVCLHPATARKLNDEKQPGQEPWRGTGEAPHLKGVAIEMA